MEGIAAVKRRAAPLAFLLVFVGLVSLVAVSGVFGGTARPRTAVATPGTVVVELLPSDFDRSGEPARGAASAEDIADGTPQLEDQAAAEGQTVADGAQVSEVPSDTGAASVPHEDAASAPTEQPGTTEEDDGAVEGGISGEGSVGEQNDQAEVATTSAPATIAGAEGVDDWSGSYEVKVGDTPYGIARRLGVSVDRLMRENGIADPTTLQVGTVLRVPTD
jgi:LysM repeat protein